jgi:hypothetical protein
MLKPADEMPLSNVRFENIRINHEGQQNFMELFPQADYSSISKLWPGGPVPGRISNVYFKDIFLTGNFTGKYGQVYVYGPDDNHSVDGVTFENVVRHGQPTLRTSPEVNVGGSAYNIVFTGATTTTTTTLPDVIVTALSYASGSFTATVKNQGSTATPSGVPIGVGYFVDGVYKTWGSVLGPLAAGATVTIGTRGSSYSIPAGTHTIMAYADDVNRFAESSETNNQLSQTPSVGRSKTTTSACPTPADPNTYSASTDFSGSQGCRQWSYRDSSGASMNFDAANNRWQGSEQYLSLQNASGHPGNGPDAVRRWTAPGAGSIRITGHVFDSNRGGGDGVSVLIKKGATELWKQTIANGNTTGFNYDLTTPVAAGDTIDFIINKLTNNGWDSTGFDPTIVFSATTATTTTNIPDVIVTAFSYANGSFTSTVKNQGSAATPAGVIIGVGYFVDGQYKTAGTVSGPLAAGATVTIGTRRSSYSIPAGTHTIMAYADDVNRFAESSETNNQLSQTITVP